MRITIIGSAGYVGLVTGACFSEMGNQIYCVDHDRQKIDRLNQGILPLYEPGLEDIVKRNIKEKNLIFSTDLSAALSHCNICFIAVGTPMASDGSADMQYVYAVAKSIGEIMTRDMVVVMKSTVPVGTASIVKKMITGILNQRGVSYKVDVAANPEFLKEGSAVEDCMRPDRIVIGTDNPETARLLKDLYAPVIMNNDRFVVMDPKSAEMTKYAANAMLATRISFMNEMAHICEQVGANIKNVRLGMGSDKRIGFSFLYAGCGYGGSCFPKDVQALIQTGKKSGYSPSILEQVEAVNQKQKLVLVHKVLNRFGNDLSGKTFALWGLAFKPNTNDIREAPSLEMIQALVGKGAKIQAYDPQAVQETQCALGPDKNITYTHSKYPALNRADALLLVTEWKEFRSPDFEKMGALMKNKIIFDGRNQYNPARLHQWGFECHQIGIPPLT